MLYVSFGAHLFVILVCVFPRLFVSWWGSEGWNVTIINRGSNATLRWPNPPSGKHSERARQWAMKERAVGQILGSSFRFDLDLLWHIRPTFPLRWASGLKLGGFFFFFLPTHSFLFPSNFFLPSFNPARTQSSWIYIVMSALALSVSLSGRAECSGTREGAGGCWEHPTAAG